MNPSRVVWAVFLGACGGHATPPPTGTVLAETLEQPLALQPSRDVLVIQSVMVNPEGGAFPSHEIDTVATTGGKPVELAELPMGWMAVVDETAYFPPAATRRPRCSARAGTARRGCRTTSMARRCSSIGRARSRPSLHRRDRSRVSP
jgi:hypothetical protein